jgi:hypothetical protein
MEVSGALAQGRKAAAWKNDLPLKMRNGKPVFGSKNCGLKRGSAPRRLRDQQRPET